MRRDYLFSILLVLLTLCVFAKTLGHGFVLWDDDINIFANPRLQSDSPSGLSSFWKAPYTGLYIPVTYSAWTLLARVSEKTSSGELNLGEIVDPLLFHAANLLFHLASVLVVFALVYRLLPKPNLAAAALGAALFAIHPLQVEAVAWATGLKDLLSTFLALLSALLYLRHRRQADTPSLLRARDPNLYLLSIACFLLALLAKPGVVILPALLALIDIGLLNTPVKKCLRALVPFAAIAVAAVALTLAVQQSGTLAFPPEKIALWKRPVVALDALAFYITKFFIPWQLAPDYGRTPSMALALNKWIPVWLLPLLIAFLISRAGEYRRFYAVALGLALVALAPVLGLLTFAHQGLSTVADRYCYLPMLGAALALAGWLSLTPVRWPRTLAAGLAIVLALVSFKQVSHWKNSASLFTRTLEINPASVIAHYNLGILASHQDRPRDAIHHYREAIALKPEFPFPYSNLGLVLNREKQHALAIPVLEEALRLSPDDPVPHGNLALAYASLQRFPEACTHYLRAAELQPGNPKAMIDLGYALANDNQFDAAAEWLEKSAHLDPRLTLAHSGLGKIYLQQHQFEKAAAALETLVALQSSDPWAHKLLADAYEGHGAYDRARDVSSRALALARATPGYPADLTQRIQTNHLRYYATPEDASSDSF